MGKSDRYRKSFSSPWWEIIPYTGITLSENLFEGKIFLSFFIDWKKDKSPFYLRCNSFTSEVKVLNKTNFLLAKGQIIITNKYY